jgi:hypothetical protein
VAKLLEERLPRRIMVDPILDLLYLLFGALADEVLSKKIPVNIVAHIDTRVVQHME